MKKQFFLKTALVLILSGFLWSCDNDEPKTKDVTIGNLTYELNNIDSVATVTGLATSYNKNLLIPSSVTYNKGNYPVVKVDEDAFYRSTIQSITIPPSVTYIGKNAIGSCQNLQDVIIEDSATPLRWVNFQIAESLIEIPNMYIGRTMTETINTLPSRQLTLGKYVTSIGFRSKFYDAVNIKSYAVNPPTFNADGTNSFFMSPVSVPESSLELYQNAPVWKNFVYYTTF